MRRRGRSSTPSRGATARRRRASRGTRNPLLAFCLVLALAACHREQRGIGNDAASSRRPLPVRVSGLQPGMTLGSTTALKNPYEGNSDAANQGQRLFEQYNCAGCHFHGGGGIGPPLMD